MKTPPHKMAFWAGQFKFEWGRTTATKVMYGSTLPVWHVTVVYRNKIRGHYMYATYEPRYEYCFTNDKQTSPYKIEIP